MVSGVVNGQNKETKVIGVIGGSVTFTCDLPQAENAQIAWKDKVWNSDHGAELIFNSSISMEIAQSHGFKDHMEVETEFDFCYDSRVKLKFTRFLVFF